MAEARIVYEGRASFGSNRGTASQHYKRFAKAGVPGYVLDDEEKAEDPREWDDEFGYLITWHGDIRRRNSFGQMFEPIPLQAVRAYEVFLAKVGLEMTAFDEDMIYRLDDLWMDCQPKTKEERETRRRNMKATRH